MINPGLSAMEHRQTQLGLEAVKRALTPPSSDNPNPAHGLNQVIGMARQLGAQVERLKLAKQIVRQWREVEALVEWVEMEVESGMPVTSKVARAIVRLRAVGEWVRRDKERMHEACMLRGYELTPLKSAEPLPKYPPK